MRLLLFFDLPVETPANRHEYQLFHKHLVKSGFIMMQKSVYSKLMTTPSAELTVRRELRAHKPPDGVIQIISITEKQFAKMEFIIGEKHSDIIDSDQRLIIL